MSNRGKESAKIRAEQRAIAVRSAAKLPRPTPEQLERIAHHIEQVIQHGQFVHERRISLVDVMHRDGAMPTELWAAADQFRTWYWTAEPPSMGVSSYGEYEDRPFSSRALANDERMAARMRVRMACFAMFAVYTHDPRAKPDPEKMGLVVDYDLMDQVIPAILSTKKEVTQASVGKALTLYTGTKQLPAAGGAIITWCLERLALHMRARTR